MVLLHYVVCLEVCLRSSPRLSRSLGAGVLASCPLVSVVAFSPRPLWMRHPFAWVVFLTTVCQSALVMADLATMLATLWGVSLRLRLPQLVLRSPSLPSLQASQVLVP